jgi:hypothetical protein
VSRLPRVRGRRRLGDPHQTTEEFLLELAREEVRSGRIPPYQIAQRLAAAVEATAPQAAADLGRRIRRTAPRQLRQLRRLHAGFQEHIQKHWGEAIGDLELLAAIFREFGDQLFREGLAQRKLRNPTFRALADLHARACRVTAEIVCLLRNGFADGAHARWRTLHEIAVVSTLLSNHDRDLAQRYLYHFYVKECKAAEDYQLHCAALGGKPLPSRRLQALQRRRDKVCARFGRFFGSDWGWATVLTPDAKRPPRFPDLEAGCALESFRRLVATANDDVHAGPRGLQPAGVDLHGHGFLLAGASDAGLAEPGANAAISLTHIAWARLNFAPSIDHGITVDTLLLLERDCVASFDDAHRKVRELTLRNLAKQAEREPRGRRRSAAARKG